MGHKINKQEEWTDDDYQKLMNQANSIDVPYDFIEEQADAAQIEIFKDFLNKDNNNTNHGHTHR